MHSMRGENETKGKKWRWPQINLKSTRNAGETLSHYISYSKIMHANLNQRTRQITTQQLHIYTIVQLKLQVHAIICAVSALCVFLHVEYMRSPDYLRFLSLSLSLLALSNIFLSFFSSYLHSLSSHWTKLHKIPFSISQYIIFFFVLSSCFSMYQR